MNPPNPVSSQPTTPIVPPISGSEIKSPPENTGINSKNLKLIGIIFGVLTLLLVIASAIMLTTSRTSLESEAPLQNELETQATITPTVEPKKVFQGEGFSFEYPTTWLEEGSTKISTKLIPSDYSNKETPDQRLLISVDEGSSNKFAFLFVNNEKIKSLVLDDTEAKSSENTLGYIVVAERNGKFYTLILSADDKSIENKYKNDFDELIKSFKFTTPLSKEDPKNNSQKILAIEYLDANVRFVSNLKKYPCDLPQAIPGKSLSDLSECLDSLIDGGELKYGIKNLPKSQLNDVIVTFNSNSGVLQACYSSGKSCESVILKL